MPLPSFARLSRGRFAMSAFLVAASALSRAATPPPPPAGWTAQASGDVEVYRLDRGGRRFEMRLFPAEPVPASFDDWFAGRLARPMQGVVAERFAPAPVRSPLVRSALARGRGGHGEALTLMRAGCRRSDGSVAFVELVSPDDEAFARAATSEGLALFADVCRGGGTAVAGAAASGAGAAVASASAAKPAPSAPGYAFATKTPGSGVQGSQIEGVMEYWRNDQAGMTMQVHTFYYLLLKDGTFHDGLPPVWFEDFDVASSRKGEPGLWGHWTRTGQQVRFVWPNGYNITLDPGSTRLPARPGETLNGVWKGFSAYSTGFSVSMSHWSVQFTKDGRFLKSSDNSVTGSVGTGVGGVPTGGAVISDDQGTTSTMGGANFATARQRRAANPRGNREGSYKLDGYDIELDYDNGVVERRPFCATSDRTQIWFEGDELSSTLR